MSGGWVVTGRAGRRRHDLTAGHLVASLRVRDDGSWEWAVGVVRDLLGVRLWGGQCDTWKAARSAAEGAVLTASQAMYDAVGGARRRT